MQLKGTITALITPFINQQIDEEGLVQNIHYQIEQGINGLLLLGSTGEAFTLSPIEQEKVIKIAVKEAKGKVPIWVGTGSNCTRQTIEKTKRAKDLGADMASLVTPYYNKPTQEGIFRHFEAIATQVDISLIIYNVPARCGVNIETATLLRIAGLPHVLGVKEASGHVNQVGNTLYTLLEKYPHFAVFSGDDTLTLPLMALGAKGVISVVSNLIPKQMVGLVNAILKGDFEYARKLHYQLLPLFNTSMIETNPIPIKAAMDLCKMPAGECRLPLCSLQPENLNHLRQLLLRMQLLSS